MVHTRANTSDDHNWYQSRKIVGFRMGIRISITYINYNNTSYKWQHMSNLTYLTNKDILKI